MQNDGNAYTGCVLAHFFQSSRLCWGNGAIHTIGGSDRADVVCAGNSASIPRMLDEGVRRIDAAYSRALAAGLLTADRTLEKIEIPVLDSVAEEIENRNEGASAAAPDRPAPSTAAKARERR